MKTVNIKDYLRNGKSATVALQEAIDYCFLQGGGEVLVPEGDYYIGGIIIRSNIKLHLLENAHLIASRNPEDYMSFLDDKITPVSEADTTDALWKPVLERTHNDHINKPASRWNNAIIKAIDSENISIIGEVGSYIDGQDCFDEVGEEYFRGPHAINMHRCSNIYFCGYEIRNSANWAHALFDCNNITAKELKVIAGHDGIHFTTCTDITICDCDFQTGDDCIAGIDNENVYVNNCRLNTACNAFRFGGVNITIENCCFYGPGNYLHRSSLNDEEKRKGIVAKNKNHRNNMLSAFLYYADLTRQIRHNAGNILFKNCEFKNVDRFLEYNFSGSNPWQRNKPLETVSFENITAQGIKMPLVLYGDKDVRVSLEMTDCDVEFSDDVKCSFMHLCNYNKIILKDVMVKGLKGDVLIKKWSDDGDIIYDNLNCADFDGEMEKVSDEDFTCQWI